MSINWKEVERYERDNPPDFVPEEVERRAKECVSRMFGHKPKFDLDTGQNFEGEQIDPDELKRRGY